MIQILIVALLTMKTGLSVIADVLNFKSHRYTDEVRAEFGEQYSQQQHEKAHSYLGENLKVQILSESLKWFLQVFAFCFGYFGWVDERIVSRGFTDSTLRGLLFFAVLGVVQWVISVPFSLYHTFSIETRYGFNKTTLKTWITDQVKGALVGSLLGGLLLSVLFWLLERLGTHAWVWAWSFLNVFQIVVLFVAPVLIFPLFYKFEPIPEGELKEQMQAYADRIGFGLKGVFQIDASKRSTKSNAFFSGFGRFRRFVMFDTLMSQYSVRELMAVFAHETGHFRSNHIIKMLFLSVATSFVLFFSLGQIYQNPKFFEAFGFRGITPGAGLFIVSFIFGPISELLSFATSALSRKFEYEADRFSVSTQNDPEALMTALKKMSVDHLSHLTPHPLKVAIDYSHPPILSRVRALKNQMRALNL